MTIKNIFIFLLGLLLMGCASLKMKNKEEKNYFDAPSNQTEVFSSSEIEPLETLGLSFDKEEDEGLKKREFVTL